MSRYTNRPAHTGYDMCPDECDAEVIANIERKQVGLPTRKNKGNGKAAIKPKLLLDQDHLTSKGYFVNSHLLLLPTGQEMPLALRRIFNHHPFQSKLVRTSWNPISDEELNDMFPEHDIFWLCESDYLPAELVKAIVQAASGEMGKPKREITNEIILG